MVLRFVRSWGPALGMMAIIFAFSSIPSAEMPDFNQADFLVKKGGHALGFGLLALSYFHAIRPWQDASNTPARAYGIAWLMTVLFAVTDEFHQSYVLGRNPTSMDVLVDAFGAAVALVLSAWWRMKIVGKKVF